MARQTNVRAPTALPLMEPPQPLVFRLGVAVVTIGAAAATTTTPTVEAAIQQQFDRLQQRLDAAKDKLDEIPSEALWSFTTGLDPYHGLKKRVQMYANGTVRMIIRGVNHATRPKLAVTNASLKLWELAAMFPRLVDPVSRDPGVPLKMFANAELPGAFVMAVKYLLWEREQCARERCERIDYSPIGDPQPPEGGTQSPAGPTELDWLASSYWPSTGNTALEDAYGLHAANRERWLMGPSPNGLDAAMAAAAAGGSTLAEAITLLMLSEPAAATGDLRSVAVLEAQMAAVTTRWPGAGAATHGAAASAVPSTATDSAGCDSAGCDLYTSDAGIDVAGDYNRQEELTAGIHLGQAVCGLMCLRRGGSMLLKMYTFTRPESRWLISSLAGLFDEFYITKPRTSRAQNSEVYLVGLGYRGRSNAAVATCELRAALASAAAGVAVPAVAAAAIPAVAIPSAQLLDAAEKLYQRQIDYLDWFQRVWSAAGTKTAAIMHRNPVYQRATAAAQDQWWRECWPGAE